MRTSSRILLTSAVVLILVWVGVAFATQTTPSLPVANDVEKDQLVVAATLYPLYDLLRQVAGDEVEVLLLLPPGAHAESFELPPDAVRKLAKANAVFTIGYDVDEWARGFIPKGSIEVSANPTAPDPGSNCPLCQDIPLEPTPLLCKANDCNPHFWLSPKHAVNMVREIYDGLMFVDHANGIIRSEEEAFARRDRALALIRKLQALDSEVREVLNDAPNRNLITFHDAYPYFAAAYNLNMVGTFEPSPGREPTAEDLVELNRLVKEFDIKTVYTEPQSSPAAIQAFLQDLKLDVKELDDLGGLPGRETYQDLIRFNANAIASPPSGGQAP